MFLWCKKANSFIAVNWNVFIFSDFLWRKCTQHCTKLPCPETRQLAQIHYEFAVLFFLCKIVLDIPSCLRLKFRAGILLPKVFWPTVRKKCSSDWEKLFKLLAEGGEFEKSLSFHLKNLFKQWKVRTIFGNRIFLEVSQNLYIRTIRIQIGKNY